MNTGNDHKDSGQNVEVILVPETQSTDLIVAYFRDISPVAGTVTITCFGKAWTTYWGSHGHVDVKTFFCKADEGYLLSRLQGDTSRLLKQFRKIEESHLLKIIKALQRHLNLHSGELGEAKAS